MTTPPNKGKMKMKMKDDKQEPSQTKDPPANPTPKQPSTEKSYEAWCSRPVNYPMAGYRYSS